MTWTAPETTRDDPPRVADERTMPDAWPGLARAAVAGHSLDKTYFQEWRQTDVSLQWIYVHMIGEYARRGGHADILRERIDGATGD